MSNTQQVKKQKQEEALSAWISNRCRGLIAGATGFGKTLVGLLALQYHMENNPEGKVLLLVPTVKLRDVDWKEEFTKWGFSHWWKTTVKELCYDSIGKEDLSKYSMLILDEAHNLTTPMWNKSKMDKYEGAVIQLSATPPDQKREYDKYTMMNKLGGVVFTITLDEAVELKLVSEYYIVGIRVPLSDEKNIPAGSKAKPFLTSERKQYEYLENIVLKAKIDYEAADDIVILDMKLPANADSQTIDSELAKYRAKTYSRYQAAIMNRNHFLYRSPSKTAFAKDLLAFLLKQGRVLVFGGSIDQIDEIMPGATFHSKSPDDRALEDFRAGLTDALGAIGSLNEGANLGKIDFEIFVQLSSNPREMRQRLGRGIRFLIGHKMYAFMLLSEGTADERWYKKAVEGLDPKRISLTHAKQYAHIKPST